MTTPLDISAHVFVATFIPGEGDGVVFNNVVSVHTSYEQPNNVAFEFAVYDRAQDLTAMTVSISLDDLVRVVAAHQPATQTPKETV